MKSPSITRMAPENASRKNGILAVMVAVVIGVLLLVVVTPGVSVSMKVARKNAASGNARNIALAYRLYATNDGNFRTIKKGDDPKKGLVSTPAQFAEVLSRFSDFGIGDAWYIDSDDALDGVTIPQYVLSPGYDGKNQLVGVSPISWAVVVNVDENFVKNAETYPLLWTRGLRENGHWVKDSPWRGEGGHVAFGDAHVRWFDNLKLEENQLRNFTAHTKTANFREAIGPDAEVLEDFPTQ